MSGTIGTGLNLHSATGYEWIFQAIEEETLVGVTDGSYIREFYPHLCLAALVLECSKGHGRLILSFSEQCLKANAYHGELMGLMALHLLLLSVNQVRPQLTGSVHIYLDCLGALNKVEHLPPHHIPSQCRHSDILKNIMVNFSDLSFWRIFSHVKAHQDDTKDFASLNRLAQLNCVCDSEAKTAILHTDLVNIPRQQAFPLEPITLFIDGRKVTTESGPSIRFAAQCKEAREVFAERGILFGDQFDEVAWKHVYSTLHLVPKMFQIFTCTQVFDILANFHFYNKRDKTICPMCPSCTIAHETAGHILRCREKGG